jgi:hypothetical protein
MSLVPCLAESPGQPPQASDTLHCRTLAGHHHGRGRPAGAENLSPAPSALRWVHGILLDPHVHMKLGRDPDSTKKQYKKPLSPPHQKKEHQQEGYFQG